MIQFADRLPGECDWRDHLPAVDPDKLALLNRSGLNRVNMLLVFAFREADKGRRKGLTWPDGWRNGAGQAIKRRADHWEDAWGMLRAEASKLRAFLHDSRPKRRADIQRSAIWSGRSEALARRLGKNPLFPQKKPRRLGREQWFNVLLHLSNAYRLDTGHTPTLTSREWQPCPAANSFDAYLATFCELANLPLAAMRHLFANHRYAFQSNHFTS